MNIIFQHNTNTTHFLTCVYVNLFFVIFFTKKFYQTLQAHPVYSV